jgi:hypothetical protein
MRWIDHPLWTTVGVRRCVLLRTMSMKPDAGGTVRMLLNVTGGMVAGRGGRRAVERSS